MAQSEALQGVVWGAWGQPFPGAQHRASALARARLPPGPPSSPNPASLVRTRSCQQGWGRCTKGLGKEQLMNGKFLMDNGFKYMQITEAAWADGSNKGRNW